MIKINLLPVRHEAKGVSLKVQAGIAGAVLILTISVCYYFLNGINRQIQAVKLESANIESEIKRLQEVIGEIDKIKERKADLEKKLSVIDELETGRLNTVKAMELVARAVPERLWLDSMSYKGETIQMTGFAVDNQIIAKFIQALSATPGVRDVILGETKRETFEKLDVVRFTLTFNLKPSTTGNKRG